MKKFFIFFILALSTLLSPKGSGAERNRDDKLMKHKRYVHGVPVVSTNNVTVRESDGLATLTISLSAAARAPVRVHYKTEDGTAKHHWDYKKISGTIVIPAGSVSGAINIRIIKDNQSESAEYFIVRFWLGRHEHDATMGDRTGRVTITEEENINTTSYVELNNLVVLYTNTNGGTIEDTSLLGPALKETSAFYWRHSHMALNIKWTIYVIDDYLNRVHADGWIYPWEVEADLKSKGFDVDPFDAVVAIARGGAALAWSVDWNIDNQLEGAHYFQVPWWEEHYLFSWFFVHEFNHVVDEMCHFSGHPEYPHNHPSEARLRGEYVPHSGSNWDLNAGILQSWNRQLWFDITKPRTVPGNITRDGWGTIRSSSDNDLDTIPDNEPDVPLDEKRFASSSHRKDTDHDGLSDLQEAMAGIFLRTDPRGVDSDCDGIADGKDTEPLYPINTTVPEVQSLTLEQDITEWPLAGHYFFNSPDNAASSLFVGYVKNDYTRNYLYIGFSVPFEMTGCRVLLDANNDGVFYGNDNIELIMNGNSIEAVNLYDAVSSPPNDIKVPLSPTYFAGALKSDAGWSSYQLIIPQLPQYGLAVQPAEQIGIYIEMPGAGTIQIPGSGTMFEPDDLLSITLGEPAAAKKPVTITKETRNDFTQLEGTAYPNPSAQSFTLQWKGNSEQVKITITDATGRLIETRRAVKTNTLQIGAQWNPGLYYAEITQGSEKVVLKLVKQ